jgi:hypothetical protein
VKTKSIEWLTRTWADARTHAEEIRRGVGEDTARAIVMTNRQLVGAPNVMTLAALLQSTRRFPAIVLACPDLIEFDRVAFNEAIPDASLQVIDWCHPATPEATDITLLCENQLPRSAATLAGYDAKTIALLTGIANRPSGRQHQAIRSILHAASDPLIVVEEWTHPDLLATAAARLTGHSEQETAAHVERWLQQPRKPAARQRQPCPDGLLSVLDLPTLVLPAAA